MARPPISISYRRLRIESLFLWAVAAAFLLCYPSDGMAQISQQPIADLYHSSWVTKDGAPRGITSLAQTRDGYLWIGTTLGLYRFDGTRFAEYPDVGNSPKLSSTIINALAADEDNGVWVGYDHHGISHITRGHVTNIELPSYLGDNAVLKIYCCARDSVWVLVGDTLLRWMNGSWQDMASLQGLPRSSYWSLLADRGGNIWISTPKGIYEWGSGDDRFRLFSGKITNSTQFAQASDGTIWIGDNAGNIRPLTSTCPRPSSSVRVTSSFLFDASGKLWIGSDERGVTRASPSRASCQYMENAEAFTLENGLTSNSTRALLEDHFGDVWVGTPMGLDRFRPRHFTPFGNQDFKSYPALAAAPDGSVWIQKLNQKLVHVSDRGIHEIGPLRDISPLTSDSRSGVWLFDRMGQQLLHYNSAEHLDRKVPAPPKFGQATVKSIVSKPDGSVLVTFASNGIWSCSDTWHSVDGPQFKTPTTLTQDGEMTWIGYSDNSIQSLTGSTREKYDSRNGVDIATPLVIAPHGATLWVGGTEGVDFMVEGRFHPLLVRAPEKLRGVSGLAFDSNDDLWLNTGFGAMQIKSKEISRALQDPQHAVITEVYGSADGVTGLPTQTWPAPSLIRDGHDRLWFATAGNLVSIDPNVLAGPRSKPFVDLQTIRINGKRLAASEFDQHPVRLEGGRMNRIEFHFGAVDLDHPNHIIYRYWLAGEDKGWQDAGNSHMAMYSRLRPGHYVFRVAATKGDAEWVELSSPFQFDIRPAFYQTTWFLVACWILAAFCLWLLYLARVRSISVRLRERLEERSKERLRIARNLHDTLLQSIHGLMLTFHYAADELGSDAPALPALQDALKRADALILEGRNSLQELRGEADREKSLSELLAETVRDEVAANSSSIQIAEEGIPYPVRPLVQEEFCRIGTEAIRNALRHAQASNVYVVVFYGRRFLRLTCRDDGVGIPDGIVRTSGKKGHWGLTGMQERARSIGAKFSLWTGEGDGTEIDVRLCSRLAYDHLTVVDRLFALLRTRRGGPYT
jgi:ligand-binding sensor domain-containing protein